MLYRLLVWYSVITALFRCPSSIADLDDKSPNVCKPYLTARSHLTPYLEPYYNTYAAPYVDNARPYIDKLDKQIYVPAVRLGKQNYEKYGAHRIDLARAYGQGHWEKTLRPRLELAREQAKNQYDSSLAPRVNRASAITAPYYKVARQNLLDTYHSHVLPAYTYSLPYAQHGYELGYNFVFDTALPYAQWAGTSAAVFVDRTLWPKMRILYGENVEPQLVRIGERLGRYRDGKKVKATIKEHDR